MKARRKFPGHSEIPYLTLYFAGTLAVLPNLIVQGYAPRGGGGGGGAGRHVGMEAPISCLKWMAVELSSLVALVDCKGCCRGVWGGGGGGGKAPSSGREGVYR